MNTNYVEPLVFVLYVPWYRVGQVCAIFYKQSFAFSCVIFFQVPQMYTWAGIAIHAVHTMFKTSLRIFVKISLSGGLEESYMSRS
jgi:hypothetical protein